MTALCPACWRVVPTDAKICPHCHVDLVRLDRRDFREKLLSALSHPDRDTVIRAARSLAARHDPEAAHAIERAMQRFTREPHVVVGLLDALMYLEDRDACRIALDALAHPSFMVRRTASRVLDHVRQREFPICDHHVP